MKLVFDFGSVVFRWRPLALMQRALPQRASDEHSAAHWVQQVFQGFGGDWGEFDRGALAPHTLVERIVQRTGLHADEVRLVMDEIPIELAPMADTVDLLARLRHGSAPLYFLSNMPAPMADHLEREHECVRWFVDGVFSARVGLIKPELAIFEHAAARFGAAPRELVLLDDNAHNIVAARAAGWNAVHFLDAPQTERALRDAGWWPADVA